MLSPMSCATAAAWLRASMEMSLPRIWAMSPQLAVPVIVLPSLVSRGLVSAAGSCSATTSGSGMDVPIRYWLSWAVSVPGTESTVHTPG